ncbi:hypothetical protein DM860_005019 [Cuscuta australis]|uniref:TF-B3 domain-containing protein n=1 Tax=Cuscuta australis TaxID=267555 RepID=A0A328DNA4_9ASTE|nr:hypothetical protein DM860_005019 [Cuscuta australis]
MIFSQTTSCRIVSPPTNKTAKADHDSFTSSSDDDDDDDDEKIIKAPRESRKSKRKSSCNYAHASGSGSSKRSKLASGKGIQVKTESTESEMEEGFQKKRFSNVNLTAKFPYFEIVVKKSHKDSIFVPMGFARETGIIHEKVIKMMSSENRSREKVEIHRVNNRVLMVKGWGGFRSANNIKVGDKCSFTLLNPNSHGTMRLLVKKLPKC